MKAAIVCVLLGVAWTTAGKDDEEEPAPDDSKDDSFKKPIELSGDATVAMTTSYAVLGQRRVDMVLYLYKEGRPAGARIALATTTTATPSTPSSSSISIPAATASSMASPATSRRTDPTC